MINLLFALVACDGSGTGPDDSGSHNDDTSVTSGFSAKLEITLPDGESVDETNVSVDGDAVPSCDADTHKCSYTVDEPDTYTVEADCEATYFAPLTVTVTEEDDGSTLSSAWTTGGCGDANWEVGDGLCSSWTNGQVACDFTGRWQGIEDDIWDVDFDLTMAPVDLNGDGVMDAVVNGQSPFGNSTNASGTTFYGANGDMFTEGEALKEIGDGTYEKASCADFDALSIVTHNGGPDHFRRISD